MIAKYRTRWAGSRWARIEAVKVERETNACVWINGRRAAKANGYEHYHNTWEEAHSFLMKAAELSVTNARRQLELASSHLGNIKGMKKPQEGSL